MRLATFYSAGGLPKSDIVRRLGRGLEPLLRETYPALPRPYVAKGAAGGEGRTTIRGVAPCSLTCYRASQSYRRRVVSLTSAHGRERPCTLMLFPRTPRLHWARLAGGV